MTVLFLLSLALAALCAGTALRERRRARRILQSLDRMLDRAIAGDFTEDCFDESLLSSVESKMAHYLAASTVSARNLQEEKDRIKTLVADISHQTKTPIANVLLYAQLLAEQELSGEERTCVAALEGQAEKLRTLIEALVKTSRLETGILALHPVPAAIQPVLEDAVGQFLPRAAAKDITLTCEPADVHAVFDPKWTNEAVCNLIDNAVKYTPAGGTVTVRAAAYELFCRIDVADNGPGIPEDEQSRVFGRFYRGAAARGDEGVGIGLYLTRQIAAGQGGYVKVASAPGQGATFSLFLPRDPNLAEL